MKKLAFLLTSFILLSCWKNNKEEEQFYAEDNAPIDTTLAASRSATKIKSFIIPP